MRSRTHNALPKLTMNESIPASSREMLGDSRLLTVQRGRKLCIRAPPGHHPFCRCCCCYFNALFLLLSAQRFLPAEATPVPLGQTPMCRSAVSSLDSYLLLLLLLLPLLPACPNQPGTSSSCRKP
jgi:hypothetical protein